MTDCEGNDTLLSRLREHIDQWNREFSCEDFSISISMGCAIWQPGMDVTDVLQDADEKMYVMKKQKKS